MVCTVYGTIESTEFFHPVTVLQQTARNKEHAMELYVGTLCHKPIGVIVVIVLHFDSYVRIEVLIFYLEQQKFFRHDAHMTIIVRSLVCLWTAIEIYTF